MYKLVAIDLDGTLLNTEKEISDRNKKAVSKAIEKGVKVVVCSGRVFSGARLFAKQVGSKDPVIACNGAIISEHIDGKVVYSNTISTEDCLKILDIAHKYKVYYHIYAGDLMLTEKLEYTSLKYFEKNKVLCEKDRVKIEIVDDMAEKVKKIEGSVLKFVVVNSDLELLKKVRDEIEKIPNVDVMSSNYDNFEVMNKGVNKGAALKILSDKLDIAPEEMVSIGDNENDITMLKYAGLGIVMGNGMDCARDVAQYVTDTNDNDGVAKAIEKFILGS